MQTYLMNQQFSRIAVRPEPDTAADAASLLGTAIQDSETPVMEIACALARISNLLAKSRTQATSQSPCADDYRQLIENDISICIQSLQFHDRLIQQLTAVRRLMGAQAMPGELCSGFMPAEGSGELF